MCLLQEEDRILTVGYSAKNKQDNNHPPDFKHSASLSIMPPSLSSPSSSQVHSLPEAASATSSSFSPSSSDVTPHQHHQPFQEIPILINVKKHHTTTTATGPFSRTTKSIVRLRDLTHNGLVSDQLHLNDFIKKKSVPLLDDNINSSKEYPNSSTYFDSAFNSSYQMTSTEELTSKKVLINSTLDSISSYNSTFRTSEFNPSSSISYPLQSDTLPKTRTKGKGKNRGGKSKGKGKKKSKMKLKQKFNEKIAKKEGLIKLYIGGVFDLFESSNTSQGHYGQDELTSALMAIEHINEQRFIPGYYLDMIYKDAQVRYSFLSLSLFA